MSIDLAEVKNIYEPKSHKEVNAYLGLGWGLINSSSGNWPEGNEAYISIH